MTAERLRRDDVALEHYRRYLAELPEAENRAVVERRIAFLEAQLAGATAEATTEPGDDADASADPAPTGDDDERDAPRGALVTTYALAGATAAAGAVLLWSGLDAQDAQGVYLDAVDAGDLPAAEAALDALHDAERRTNLLVGVTAAVAAGTLAAALVHLLRDDADEPPAVEASVSVGRRAAGLVLQGAF